jgi:hypothetical protein
MRIQKLTLFIITTLIFLSCKKNDDDMVDDKGSWSLGTTQYNIISTKRESASGYFILSGSDPKLPANILSIYFSSQPTTSGKFNVVNFDNDVSLSSNQIGIRSTVPSEGVYSSTGISDNISWSTSSPVTVTIQSGKMKVEIPKMTTMIDAPTYIDTVSLQGIIKE